jgi:hypothetical protein
MITEKIAETEAFFPLYLRKFRDRYDALLSIFSYKIDRSTSSRSPFLFRECLNFGLDVWYGSKEQVAGLKDAVDREIDHFASNHGTIPAFFRAMHHCH